jgi:hypothetical protein
MITLTEHKFVLLSVCLAMVAAPSVVRAQKVDVRKAKSSPDGQTLWYDCKEIGVEGKGWTNTLSFYDRLPAKAAAKAPAAVWSLSHCSSGMCVRFKTDSPSIQVRWTLVSGDLALPHMAATGVSGIDIYVKDKVGRWCFVATGLALAVSNSTACALPPGREYMVNLPLYNGVTSVEIGIPKGRTIATSESARRKPIVFYGTSITQGGCASRPGMAYTAIVGRRLDVPVINLGFSGSGKMEPEMADLLTELDPSVYVLDCIANMSAEQVAGRFEPFVQRLRHFHPDVPILLAEDSSVGNLCPTEKGRVLRRIYEKLTANGVKNLHFLASRSMLGDDTEGTVDGGHPTDLGMMRIAEVFVRALSPLLNTSP